MEVIVLLNLDWLEEVPSAARKSQLAALCLFWLRRKTKLVCYCLFKFATFSGIIESKPLSWVYSYHAGRMQTHPTMIIDGYRPCF